MNINMQGLNLLNRPMSKATQDRMERQAKRDNQIAFFEKQKENLKNMKTNSLEDIQRKLDMFQQYDDQIDAAKASYNNSQMFHILDEARERGEKIAEEAEKMAPKTPEERREEMIEEATGIDKDKGILSEVMDELEDQIEELTEMAENMAEDMAELSEENLEALSDEALAETDAAAIAQAKEINNMPVDKALPEKYRHIDYHI